MVVLGICIVILYLGIGALISGIMLWGSADRFELKEFLGSTLQWPRWFMGR